MISTFSKSIRRLWSIWCLANKEFSTNVAKAFVCSFTRVLNTREKLGEQRKPSPAANNYPVNFIHNGRQLNRQQEMNDIDQRGFIILPYAKGFSTRVAKVLRDFNVKVAHKSIRPISNILKKSQKTRSRKRLERLWFCFRWSDITRAKNTRERTHKGLSNIG